MKRATLALLALAAATLAHALPVGWQYSILETLPPALGQTKSSWSPTSPIPATAASFLATMTFTGLTAKNNTGDGTALCLITETADKHQQTFTAARKQNPNDGIGTGWYAGSTTPQGNVAPAEGRPITASDALIDGTLTIQCDSTAWAKNLQFMRAHILTQIVTRFPDAGVEQVRFVGPDAPTWKWGPRTVPGRGPRDTYG